MTETQANLIKLVRFTVFGGEDPGVEVTPGIVALAKRYDVAQLTGAKDKAFYSAVKRTSDLQQAEKELCEKLDDTGIDYVILKGSSVRRYYPEFWMRTSCDVDLLLREGDIQKTADIFGCKLSGGTSHDRGMTYKGCHIELHHDLYAEDEKTETEKVLDTAWQHASGNVFDDEFAYFYLTAHFARHFMEGGGGIRGILDVAVLKKAGKAVRGELLEQGGLDKFANACEAVADRWFLQSVNCSLKPEILNQFENAILQNSLYSDISRWAELGTASRGKTEHLISRIWLPYEKLKYEYPALDGRKWLLLWFEIKRWFRVIKRKRVRTHVRELKVISQTEGYEKELVESLGL